MNTLRILLAEDDNNLGLLLRNYLKAKGYDVTLVRTGTHALDVFSKSIFNLCIFDIMMPELDGISLTKEIRLSNNNIPIIFLTAKNQQEDIIEGFMSGADDYMTKPFSMEELLYRIEAILRRTSTGNAMAALKGDPYPLGAFIFDPMNQMLSYGNDDEYKLTTKESELLDMLYRNRNDILERNFALKTIWVDDNYFNARSMDVYISRLRKHLRKDPSLRILNVHGKGYKLIC
ncbi:MAG: response regulator transcription factor [Bacteroidales bacterium]|jgi:DNA-binding response OmpR family regulator|nr:response regulator transcription factor [Bacteroidales bacterium]